MTSRVVAFLPLLSFLLVTPASGTVLDFDEIPDGIHEIISSHGFEMSNLPGFYISSGLPSYCSPECAFNGTPSLLSQNGDSPIVLTQESGEPFDLLSFEYAEQHVHLTPATSVQVIGELAAGGTVTTSFALDRVNDGSGPLVDFQLAVLPDTFQSLSAVTFIGIGGPGSNRYSLDDIVVLPLITAVGIDVKPGRGLNLINPLSRGFVPVAILSSDTFDVADVDVTTLAFGPDEASPAEHPSPRFVDVDHDGLEDLVLHFRTFETGIAIGDTEACLTGETLDGTPFEGCNTVEVLSPKGGKP